MDSRIRLLVLAIFLQGQMVEGLPNAISSWLCQRQPTLCGANGNCNPTTGVCTCNAGVVGYDCSVVDGGACAISNACTGPKGTQWTECHLDSGAETCLCAPGWTGPTCNTKVTTMTCDGTNFDLTYITQGTPFDVYPVGFSTVPACMTITTSINLYQVPMPPNPACGVTTATATTSVGTTTTYEVSLIFQYQQGFVGPSEDYVTLQCIYSSSSAKFTGSVLQNVNFATGGLNLAGTFVDDNIGDACLTAESFHKPKGGTSFVPVIGGTTATVGDLFKLEVTLCDTTTGYDSIRLEHCWVDDGTNTITDAQGTWTAYSYRPLVTGACSDPNAPPVLFALDDGTDTATTDQASITVFVISYLPSSDDLRLFCDVTVCIDADTTPCVTKNNCGTGTAFGVDGAGRKRRETVSSNSTYTVLAGAKVSVELFARSATVNQTIQEECSITREIIIVIVVLCLLVLLLGVACVYFALKYVSRRQRRKVDDLQSVYSSKTYNS